jgi:cation diffusion facilitator CzcD-associated flavoprotein CzcO
MTSNSKSDYDAIVVGAGFGGMYMMHMLVQHGFTAQGIERGSDVGGTWYWNRYPGCQCDVESMEYSYQFSDDLQQKWEWTQRYAGQPEILRYANHVADEFNLRENFMFNASVDGATYDDDNEIWSVSTDTGKTVTARFLIMATGCLSTTNTPDFPGLAEFQGDTYHTGNWPQDGVDFTGKKVAVIGTGSSGIQAIPPIAQQSGDLTVFQRTAAYTIPAKNRPLTDEKQNGIKANYAEFRARGAMSPAAFGADFAFNMSSVLDATPEEREANFETFWNYGGFNFLAAYGDLSSSIEANEFACEFVRGKIREIVKDPATAEMLMPDTVLGCKRLCSDDGYYESFNLPHVHLVDVSTHPIDRLTANGLVTNGEKYDFDIIVFATGYDALTGSILKCNIVGSNGLALHDKWSAGPSNYLGLMTTGFPNMFTITGPGSPSALANLITGIEQHAEFITTLIEWSNTQGHTTIQADQIEEDRWIETVNTRASHTLYPTCNSWYLGANVPGKPRVFMPYVGFPDYSKKLRSVVAEDYAELNFA